MSTAMETAERAERTADYVSQVLGSTPWELIVEQVQKEFRQAEQAARAHERRKALEEAARVASRYTGPGTKNVHPDVSWEDMSDAAQTVSHTTAQGIAYGIRALANSSEPGEDT